jgi:hypothetical protein
MQWHVARSQLLPKLNLQLHSADTDRIMSRTASVLSLSNSAWKLNAVLPIQVSMNIALITALRKQDCILRLPLVTCSSADRQDSLPVSLFTHHRLDDVKNY